MTDKKLNKTVVGTSLLVLTISLLIMTGAAKGLFTYSGSTGSAQKLATIEASVSSEKKEGNVREVIVENKGTVEAKPTVTFSLESRKDGSHEDLVNNSTFDLGKDWVKVGSNNSSTFEYKGTIKENEKTSPIKITVPDGVKLHAQAKLNIK